MTDQFWANRFHACALAAGFIAFHEGRLDDSRYVKALAYELFESGAFQSREMLIPRVIDASDQDMLLSPRPTRTESDV
jgi:hypothetical protein